LIAVGTFSTAQVLLVTLYPQEGRGLSPVLTGLCFAHRRQPQHQFRHHARGIP